MELDIFLNAIYKTLLHSLWQGVLLAVIGGAIMVLARKLKSSIKYLLLTFSLVLFLGGVIYTFSLELNPTTGFSTDSIATSYTSLVESDGVNDGGLLFSAMDEIHAFYDYYLAHYDRAIVFFWFIIICLKVVMMLFDIYNIYKLRNTKRPPVTDELEKILKVICDKLGVKRSILVFESAIAKTSMVIGAIKPVVLIPLGLVTSMAPEQIEAILAHELAHIKRKDFLVNLIQSAMEIIFFFNPSVLWISSLIRNERELCCDDIAIGITGDKILYANTLFECRKHNAPAYSMAFVGNKKLLLNRVKSVLGIRKSSLNSFDRFFLGLCLVSAILTTAILTTSSTTLNGENNHYFFSSFIDPQASKVPNRVNSDEIIKLLIDDRIISNPENFSFKVTNFALYVNGNRQSKALHRQILMDFVKNYERRLHFTRSVISESD